MDALMASAPLTVGRSDFTFFVERSSQTDLASEKCRLDRALLTPALTVADLANSPHLAACSCWGAAVAILGPPEVVTATLFSAYPGDQQWAGTGGAAW